MCAFLFIAKIYFNGIYPIALVPPPGRIILKGKFRMVERLIKLERNFEK